MDKRRKFWVTITEAEDEELGTVRYRISLRAYRYPKTPATMRGLIFTSKRSFRSAQEAIAGTRQIFGNILTWKRSRGEWTASFSATFSEILD